MDRGIRKLLRNFVAWQITNDRIDPLTVDYEEAEQYLEECGEIKLNILPTPKYNLGEVVRHNNTEVRITAFRFEIRPMGTFKIYEVVNNILPGHSFDVVEQLIEPLKK